MPKLKKPAKEMDLRNALRTSKEIPGYKIGRTTSNPKGFIKHVITKHRGLEELTRKLELQNIHLPKTIFADYQHDIFLYANAGRTFADILYKMFLTGNPSKKELHNLSNYLAKLARAISRMHNIGIIHNDIQSVNIVRRQNRVGIIDFDSLCQRKINWQDLEDIYTKTFNDLWKPIVELYYIGSKYPEYMTYFQIEQNKFLLRAISRHPISAKKKEELLAKYFELFRKHNVMQFMHTKFVNQKR